MASLRRRYFAKTRVYTHFIGISLQYILLLINKIQIQVPSLAPKRKDRRKPVFSLWCSLFALGKQRPLRRGDPLRSTRRGESTKVFNVTAQSSRSIPPHRCTDSNSRYFMSYPSKRRTKEVDFYKRVDFFHLGRYNKTEGWFCSKERERYGYFL